MTSNVISLQTARELIGSGSINGKRVPLIEFMDAQQAEIERLQHDLSRSMANHVADLNPDPASKDVTRWKCVGYCRHCTVDDNQSTFVREWGHFEKSDDGVWVRAEDYEHLRAAVKAAAAHLDQPVLYTISESASANSILRGDALQALNVLRGALPAETPGDSGG